MLTALTPSILKTHGFVELEEKDMLGRPIYRLSKINSKYGDYPFEIQIVLSPQYPDSNPNCGVVSIFMKEETVATVPEDLISKEDWTEEDEKRYEENLTVFEATTQPVAWHVTTYERLKTIVESLTLTTLQYGK